MTGPACAGRADLFDAAWTDRRALADALDVCSACEVTDACRRAADDIDAQLRAQAWRNEPGGTVGLRGLWSSHWYGPPPRHDAGPWRAVAAGRETARATR